MSLTITKLEAYSYTWDVVGLGYTTDSKPIYDPDTTTTRSGLAARVFTAEGVVGEYAGQGNLAALKGAADRLLGANGLEREKIWNDLRIYSMQNDPITRAFIDTLLWDLAGKMCGLPIYALLGGYRTKIPCYPATIDGATGGWLSTIESFADYAEYCLELGVAGYKIHPYPWPDIQSHIRVVEAVGERVGGRMDLMLDSYCHYRTFAEALKVGKACDAHNYFWYEDPFHDGGVSPFAYGRLRQAISTPLLMGEKIRTIQEKMSMMVAGGTDFVRGDSHVDGITGTLKLAYGCQALGVDIEMHGGGPAHRHLIASIPNTNYYEFGWTHPDVPSYAPPIYTNGYTDGFPAAIDGDGCVDVPQGPGLGVTYDWDYIEKHSTGRIMIES